MTYQEICKKIADTYKRANVITKLANLDSYGSNVDAQMLRTFEDQMNETETVALFNYGSNSISELKKYFEEEKISSNFVFGGLVALKGVSIAYGSQSTKKTCPVATFRDYYMYHGNLGDKVMGYIALLTKEQFIAVAKKECGPTLGREEGKGRYCREIISFRDPISNAFEMQAVTFIINEHQYGLVRTLKEDLKQNPIRDEKETRKRLDGLPVTTKFNDYVASINEQREQAEEIQAQVFPGLAPFNAWRETSDERHSFQKNIFWNYYLLDYKIIHENLEVILIGSRHLFYKCAFIWTKPQHSLQPLRYPHPGSFEADMLAESAISSDDEDFWGPGGENGEFDDDYYQNKREEERKEEEIRDQEEKDKAWEEQYDEMRFIEQAALYGTPLTFDQAVGFGFKVEQTNYCESIRMYTYDIGRYKDYSDWHVNEEPSFPNEFNDKVLKLCEQQLKLSEAIELFLDYGVIFLTWNTWFFSPNYICSIEGLPGTSELFETFEPTFKDFVQKINLEKLDKVFEVVKQEKEREKEWENRKKENEETNRLASLVGPPF